MKDRRSFRWFRLCAMEFRGRRNFIEDLYGRSRCYMSYVRCAVDGEEEIEEKDEKLTTGKKIGLGATQSRGVSLHGGIFARVAVAPNRHQARPKIPCICGSGTTRDGKII